MENKNSFLVFTLIFAVVLIAFYSAEKNDLDSGLPNRSIDYSDDIASDFDITDIFKKEEMALLASEIFEYQGIRSGIVDINVTGFSKEDLGIDESVINYTEVTLKDGTVVSYIEPETEVVEIFNSVSNDGLLVVIVEDIEGNKHLIKQEDEGFELYKQCLLEEKQSIKNNKLTNLDLLLEEVELIGQYEAYFTNSNNLIRKSKVYYNKEKNYALMLSTNKQGVEYYLLDIDDDMSFDHIYAVGKEAIEIKGYITATQLDHLLYRSFLKILDENTDTYITKFMGEILIIKRVEGATDEE